MPTPRKNCLFIKIYNIYCQIKNQVRDLEFIMNYAVYHELYRELFSVMVVSGSSFYIKGSYKRQIGNKFKDVSTFLMFTPVSLGRSVVTSIIKGNQVGGAYRAGYGTQRLTSLTAGCCP